MGEYAKRTADGVEIKIGTCEDMYYIRFEDRHRVSHLEGSIDIACKPEGCRFRLPFPDEDHLLPGEYRDFNRGLRLYRGVPCQWCKHSRGATCQKCHGSGFDGHEDFTDTEALADVGNIQLHHEASGLLLNVPCYHGLKLPEVGEGMRAFWNGKGHAFELSSVRVVREDGELRTYPVIRCRFCDHAWRHTWDKILPYVGDTAMRSRLAERYADQAIAA